MNTHVSGARRPATHVALLAVLGLLLALVPGFSTAARADSVDTARTMHADTARHLLANVQPKGLGAEWVALGLARSDVDASEWLATYYANLVDDVVEKGGNLGSATNYERVIIALSAMGKDVTDIGGYDLLAGLADMSKMTAINAAVYGLIALDSRDHAIPEAAGVANPTTRQKLVDRILQVEIAGGGWAFFGSTPDPDMTGMALQALAGYTDQPAVAAAAERGVTTLSDIQRPSGAFASYGTESVASTTQAMVALTALGIDPGTDPRFTKEGNTPVTALSTFFVTGGGFWYSKPGAPNGMSTEQGFYGLTDYLRFVDGKPSLYTMNVADPVVTTTTLTAASPGPGQVTLTASVAGEGAAGVVTFREGAGAVGEATVVSGQAALELTGVAAGEHTYTATFVPSSSAHKGSTSPLVAVAVKAVVVPARTKATSKVTKPGAKVRPRAVVVTAKVTAAPGAKPAAGKVRIVVKRAGRAVITRTVKVNAKGVAKVRIGKPALRKQRKGKKVTGRYTVVVRYLGDAVTKKSSSSRSFRI